MTATDFCCSLSLRKLFFFLSVLMLSRLGKNLRRLLFQCGTYFVVNPPRLGSLHDFTRQRTRRRVKTNASTKQSPSGANRSNILLKKFRPNRPAIPRSQQFDSESP